MLMYCFCHATAHSQIALKSRSLEVEAQSTETVTLEAAPETTSYRLMLPSSAGTEGAFLTANGSNGLQWTSLNFQGWATTGNTMLDSALHFIGSMDEAIPQPLVIRTDGTERLRVAGGSGFVGIGTALPSAQLHIQGSNDAIAMRVRPSSGSASNIIVVESSTGSSSVVVSANGNLGVGSNSNPLTSLAVDGGVTFRTATINVTFDNQVVTVGNRSVLILNSNGAPVNRTIALTNGLQVGQLLYLLVAGAAGIGIELPDNINVSNANLSAAWLAESSDTLQLIWDGADWIETARANN